jgi:hypothetical protein
MESRIRRLDPGLRLNDRVLVPVQRLARMTGVSPAEIIEVLLEEIFEGDVPATAVTPPDIRRRAAIIPITRARGFTRAGNGIDLAELRREAEELRRRAQAARQRAAAARQAAGVARSRLVFSDGAHRETITPAPAARRR